ncbi:MAG: transposase, partial [Chloroflexi bacterium]|nr:transposase [Chloroflexota bacterium]
MLELVPGPRPGAQEAEGDLHRRGCVRRVCRRIASRASGWHRTLLSFADALRADLQPLLVVHKPRKKPGRKCNDDRAILDGLIWLSRTGAQWEAWPREQFGPKST